MDGELKALHIPDLGEGGTEGTITAILVTAGNSVAAGQGLVEIETDKVTLEVPADCAGRILEVHVAVGQSVAAGDLFARIDVSDATLNLPAVEAGLVTTARSAHSEAVAAWKPIAAPRGETPHRQPQPSSETPMGAPLARRTIPAGPAARREARELGIDLARVPGSGPRQRISRDDVRQYVKVSLQEREPARPVVDPLPDLSAFGAVHVEPLPRIAQTTARNMARSASVIPHAWVETRADVTSLEAARRDLCRIDVDGQPHITLSVLIVRAAAKALSAYPRFNAAYDAEHQALVIRDYVNIGLAVATRRGLVVPVVHDPLGRDLIALAQEMGELVSGARDEKLALRAYQGAGFTVSNLGGHGVETLHPLINWPEVAILGVGALVDTPRVINDQLVIRRCMSLTLGFDHRVINGADAAAFLGAIVAELENPLRLACGPPGSAAGSD